MYLNNWVTVIFVDRCKLMSIKIKRIDKCNLLKWTGTQRSAKTHCEFEYNFFQIESSKNLNATILLVKISNK